MLALIPLPIDGVSAPLQCPLLYRRGLDFPCNRPQKGCDLAGDRGDRHGIALPLRGETSIAGAQPALSFPCKLEHSLWQPLLSALVCRCQLASDRTSCRSALANQVRLVRHTAAYWLMLTVRDAIPRPLPLALAEFATLRARLLKIAARITETASRVRIAFAAACPEADLFRYIAHSLQPAAP